MVILWSVEAGSALNEFPWRNYHGGASSRAEPGQVQVKLSTGSKAQSESRTLMVSGPDQPRLISGEMAGPDRWLLTDHLISRQPGFLCPTEPFHRGGVTSAGVGQGDRYRVSNRYWARSRALSRLVRIIISLIGPQTTLHSVTSQPDSFTWNVNCCPRDTSPDTSHSQISWLRLVLLRQS